MGKITTEETVEMVIAATAILIGDYDNARKYAASLILKTLLPHEMYCGIMEDSAIYPYDRDDKRVRQWKKNILERGVCEHCGAEEQLEAHHIIKWSDFPQGRADLNNGLCLCHACHTEEHKNDSSYHMMKAKMY